MTARHLYRIAYSETALAAGDAGFRVLDNLANPRPDWREYWPIRAFFRTQPVDAAAFYGFFSPRFGDKTGLTAATVDGFVAAAADADVVTFSPFFDESAYFINVIEQGARAHHPDFATFARLWMESAGMDGDPMRLVNSSRSTVFCNYFAAKPAFWQAWLALCEPLFAACEAGQGEIVALLNAPAVYAGAAAPMKVFLIERAASILLAADPRWTVKAYPPFDLPLAGYGPQAACRLELVICDALKIAFTASGDARYRDGFLAVRRQIAAMTGAWLPPDPVPSP